MSPKTNIDLSKLLTASDEAATGDHIWAVDWEAKVPVDSIKEEDLKCPDCGETHDIEDARIVGDTTTILGGSDAQPCIERVKTYILEQNPELSDYRLRGVKLLAVAEVK